MLQETAEQTKTTHQRETHRDELRRGKDREREYCLDAGFEEVGTTGKIDPDADRK